MGEQQFPHTNIQNKKAMKLCATTKLIFWIALVSNALSQIAELDLDGEIYLKSKSSADVNGDGNVNILDLVFAVQQFSE